MKDILRSEANLSQDFKDYIEELVLNRPDELIKLFSTNSLKDNIKSVLSSTKAPEAILKWLYFMLKYTPKKYFLCHGIFHWFAIKIKFKLTGIWMNSLSLSWCNCIHDN